MTTDPYIHRHGMIINTLARYTELIQLWTLGNHALVITALQDDHSGLTALFLAQGVADGRLTQTDLNHVANLLIEQRQRICQRTEAQHG